MQAKLNRRRHQRAAATRALPSSAASPADASPPPAPPAATKNIVIIGASFAGYHVARVLAARVPPKARARVVVVEPHSHFHFTWVFPRLSVLKPDTPTTASSSKRLVVSPEGRAFIPYEGYVRPAAEGLVEWVRDRAVEIRPDEGVPAAGGTAVLAGGRTLPYAYMVVCTGSLTPAPSRIAAEDTKPGAERVLRPFQAAVAAAARIVVVGGGAVGYKVATDLKSLYGDAKTVTLVHSRPQVMHRFGPELRWVAIARAEELGVVLVTGERVVAREVDETAREAGKAYDDDGDVPDVVESRRVRSVTLMSGRKIECDLLISSMRTQPASALVAAISPVSIAANGQVLVKPMLRREVLVKGSTLAHG